MGLLHFRLVSADLPTTTLLSLNGRTAAAGRFDTLESGDEKRDDCIVAGKEALILRKKKFEWTKR